MRSMTCLLAASALTVGLVFAAPLVASAECPFPEIDHCFHHPLDLVAYEDPGPQLGTDGTGIYGVEPPRRIDPSTVDPDAVRWPTLDKSEWEALQSSYTILPCDN